MTWRSAAKAAGYGTNRRIGGQRGVQFTEVGAGGGFTAEEFVAACKPRGHVTYPPTTLVEIEDTHNRAGGMIFPQAEAEQICSEADRREVATYLDGARLWNAAVASGMPPAKLATMDSEVAQQCQPH